MVFFKTKSKIQLSTYNYQLMTTYTLISSPLGPFLIAGTDSGITHMSFQDAPNQFEIPADWIHDDAAFPAAQQQMREYFDGNRTDFELSLTPQGTAFQQQVWQELQNIPFGETISYGELAQRIGKTMAASRAVGAANGQNPIPVVIPCHRVIGANGKLTGYAGGLQIKKALLELEGVEVGEKQMKLF